VSDEQQGPVIIGDEKFIKTMANAGKVQPKKVAALRAVQPAATTDTRVEVPEPLPEMTQDEEEGVVAQLNLTVDKEGNIIGDTSGIPDHILSQLQTPESKAKMAEQYRAYRHGEKEAPRPIRWIHEREDRRIFADRCPPGMSTREWRKLCRKQFRRMTKQALKIQRSMAK
jgi:hypothetical protein